ncbi:putative SH3 domain-binding protein 5 [Scophthalmus maximus]|uniref:Putative SH3 domain-binding protein 5 n=1 Tax=Scophthalmus maximus TaxID=52904 RepID=A0A2U9CLT5_SCOMX|nr:putative SH3 domain-binding protein 5 [Scophthalmus maximus]
MRRARLTPAPAQREIALSDSEPSASPAEVTVQKRTFSLETRFSFLNLRRPRPDNAKKLDSCSQKAEPGQAGVLVKGV